MKWLGIDYDGTGLLGLPGDYVREILPDLIAEEAREAERSR